MKAFVQGNIAPASMQHVRHVAWLSKDAPIRDAADSIDPWSRWEALAVSSVLLAAGTRPLIGPTRRIGPSS